MTPPQISPEQRAEFARFPAVLRDLVTTELAAGNQIAELGHGHPAAPCGAFIKLVRDVTTRPRESSPALDYYDRNTPSHSGEFTDSRRHFFVLEPAHPTEAAPDMDALRAARDARYAAASGLPGTAASTGGRSGADLEALTPAERSIRGLRREDPKSVLARFRASMEIDYDKWREGVGYDLSLLKAASPEELRAIERLLLDRPASDWRDVEALAALGTAPARRVLQDAAQSGDARVRLAVQRYAPELIPEQQRCDSLVAALGQAEIYTGLSEALAEVVNFHPPKVIQALLRGLMERDGGSAVHLAAMLYYLHGKASEPFDWQHRPFFLRFNTTDLAERERAVRELCATIGVDPGVCLPPKRVPRPSK